MDNARTGQRNSTDPPRQIHKSSILTWIFLERGFLYSTSNCKNKPSDVESSSVLPHAHSFLQAEGPQCPFGLVFAPCCRAEGLSWGFATPGVAPGGALDSTGALWYPRPKGVNTHRSLSGGADRRLRGRISPRRFRLCVWIKG